MLEVAVSVVSAAAGELAPSMLPVLVGRKYMGDSEECFSVVDVDDNVGCCSFCCCSGGASGASNGVALGLRLAGSASCASVTTEEVGVVVASSGAAGC